MRANRRLPRPELPVPAAAGTSLPPLIPPLGNQFRVSLRPEFSGGPRRPSEPCGSYRACPPFPAEGSGQPPVMRPPFMPGSSSTRPCSPRKADPSLRNLVGRRIGQPGRRRDSRSGGIRLGGGEIWSAGTCHRFLQRDLSRARRPGTLSAGEAVDRVADSAAHRATEASLRPQGGSWLRALPILLPPGRNGMRLFPETAAVFVVSGRSGAYGPGKVPFKETEIFGRGTGLFCFLPEVPGPGKEHRHPSGKRQCFGTKRFSSVTGLGKTLPKEARRAA